MITKQLIYTALLCGSLGAATAADVIVKNTNDWQRGYHNKDQDSRPPGEKFDSQGNRINNEVRTETRDLRQDARDLKNDVKRETREVRDNIKDGANRVAAEASAAVPAAASDFDKVTKGRDLIGMKVKNDAGVTVGDIEDIAIDMRSGKINYLVLSSGGVLGVRERYHAVPLSAFRRSVEPKTLLLNVEKTALNNTPGFIKNNWPEDADRAFLDNVNSAANSGTIVREPAGTDLEIKTKTRVEDGVVKERKVDIDQK